MMNYEEFADLIEINLGETNLIKSYKFETGEQFYIEPAFYTQLMSLKEIYPDEFSKVINQLKNTVKTKRKVGFVYDYENPFLNIPGFIYLEITDITDPIQVFYEDKSHGSDYGD